GMQMASDLHYSQDSGAALRVIEDLIDGVEAVNSDLQDEDLSDDLELLRMFAQNLRRAGAESQNDVVEESPWPQD
ncbi:MAG: hypothetical protein KC561_17120, partial [Myxococcales bacterium]|nr:hypothetical protein [Myxococcales bacterium]